MITYNILEYELSERASQMQHVFSHEAIDDRERKRTAVIFQPHSRAVQDTPKIDWGSEWVMKWEAIQVYKSPLMHWGTATEDPLAFHDIKFRNLEEAIKYAKSAGNGIDVQLPRHRYYIRQSYFDNFAWKGQPEKHEVDDD